MDQNEIIITTDKFNKLFSHKSLRNLLLTDVGSYRLVMYYMSLFLTYRLYNKNSFVFQNESPKYTRSNKTYLIAKAVYIMKQVFLYGSSSNNLDILILSRNRFPILKTKDGKEFISDYLFGNVIHYLKIKHPNYKMSLINMSIEHTPKIDDIEAFSIAKYSNPHVFFKSLLSSILINIKWKSCKDEVHSFIKTTGCDYLYPSFEEFFTIKWMFYVYFHDYSLQNVLKRHKPKLIMANDDVIFLKPKSNIENLKFVRLQSASIDYEREKFRKMFFDTFSLNMEATDFFLLSGTKYEKIKQIGNCSKEYLVLGQPRYDMLYYVDKIYDKKQFIKKYKINPQHKMILWTTQCHDISNEENQKNMKVVFSSIKELGGITLIIKQHPEEDITYTEMIMEFLDKYSISAIINPTNSDIYELLYVCDLMITKDSTTAVEALALNKPVIILNLSNEPDIVDYVEKGVALGVYKEDKLKVSIEKIVKNEIELTKNRKSYIYESLYKIDGRSSERIVKFIEDMLVEYSKKK